MSERQYVGCFLFVLFLLIVQNSMGISLNEYISLTHNEKLKLDMFRDLVSDRLPHDYMKSDIYLIRWLRDADFDVFTAEEKLRNSILWREENKMDSILEEDWSDFDYEYRVHIEGCDKEGKPVISVRVQDWNLRRAIVAGQSSRVTRFFDKLFEEAETMVRRMISEGQNVTQSIVIFDMFNFNLVEQGCPRCLPIFFHVIKTYENHYAGTAHKIYSLNSPEISIPIWNVLKPRLRKQTRNLLEIHGKNKAAWSRKLLQEIDMDQLSKYFGGSKLEPLDMYDLRASGKTYKCTNV